MSNPLFHDQTKYPKQALLALALPLVVIPILCYVYPQETAFTLLLAFVFIILVLSAYYLYKTQLTVELTAEGVSYTLQSFSRKQGHIPLAEMITLEVIALDYTTLFGGWGHRKNKNGVAYVFNDGLFLHVQTAAKSHYFSISDAQKQACQASVAQYNAKIKSGTDTIPPSRV